MKYEYTKSFDRGDPSAPLIRTPRVDLELFGPKSSIKVPYVLVDSGADYSLFNIEYAKEIGINLAKCPKKNFTGIGSQNSAFIAEVAIQVQHLDRIRIPVGFIDSSFVSALLGQVGFFDAYRIKFERDHDVFELTPVKKK